MPSSIEFRDQILDAFHRALSTWPDQESFAQAATETVSHSGFAREDVVAQLHHVIRRCRADAMRAVVDDELGRAFTEVDLAAAPAHVLVLASANVPGLAIEGIAAALAVGAVALVRPSREETVLHHLLGGLRVWEPELADRIEVVGAGGLEPPWSRVDAAVVYGTDETIARVRDLVPARASGRIAGYGSRQGIAVVTAGADIDPSWATRLADDVLTFRQRGCMSPSWLFAVGDEQTTTPLVEAFGRELALARERHVAPGVEDRVAQRRATDADVIGAIAAGMSSNSTALYAGDARLTTMRVDDLDELAEHVRMLGTLLQTAVVASNRDIRAELAERLLTAGCTRTCLPGDAHLPPPGWPHDGIGRVAPLLA